MRNVLLLGVIWAIAFGACHAQEVEAAGRRMAVAARVGALYIAVPPRVELADELARHDYVFSHALQHFLERYREEHGIRASDAELSAYRDWVERNDLGDVPAETMNAITTKMIVKWKTDKHLHSKYGGDVLSQQFGLEPIAAYVALLKKMEEAGRFELFVDREAFWKRADYRASRGVAPEGCYSFDQPPWSE